MHTQKDLPCASGTSGAVEPVDAAASPPATAPQRDDAAVAPPEGYWRTHAPLLVKYGYPPVPISPGSKAPKIFRWQDRDFSTEKMLRRAYGCFGVGIKTGRPNADGHAVMALDLDICDEELAAEMVDWCRDNIGPAPARIGRPPKALLPYRTDQPFGKKFSHRFHSPDGVTHMVEVLGTGQQYVAYAIHPDTGQPYLWPEGEPPPVAELPVLTVQKVHALIGYFERRAREHGWEQIKLSKRRGDDRPHRSGRNQRQPIQKLRAALEALPPHYADDYGQWLKMGMAVHRGTRGSDAGFQLWDQWSRQSSRYDGSTGEKWRTFDE
jgi:hypothetical protein